jgi:hypothetical protein
MRQGLMIGLLTGICAFSSVSSYAAEDLSPFMRRMHTYDSTLCSSKTDKKLRRHIYKHVKHEKDVFTFYQNKLQGGFIFANKLYFLKANTWSEPTQVKLHRSLLGGKSGGGEPCVIAESSTSVMRTQQWQTFNEKISGTLRQGCMRCYPYVLKPLPVKLPPKDDHVPQASSSGVSPDSHSTHTVDLKGTVCVRFFPKGTSSKTQQAPESVYLDIISADHHYVALNQQYTYVPK